MTLQWEVKTRYGPAETFDDASEAAEHITSNDEYIEEIEADVDGFLDESYGHIEINGEDYWASNILYNMDEDAYYEIKREVQRDYADGNTDWVAEQLESMEDGETKSFEGGITVACIGVPDEDDEEDDGFDSESFESALK